jgi:hypothetical protein
VTLLLLIALNLIVWWMICPRLLAIEAAAREYWDHSCYVSDRDGNCIGCNGASEDPADHPDWCSFNVAGMKLIAALLDRKP